MTQDTNPIELSEMIKTLRSELTTAQTEGESSELKLLVEEAEIEFKVAVTRSAEAEGGVKFWVYNAAAKGRLADETTQTIRLKIKPVMGEDMEPMTVSGEE